jgi:uncharacterized membrane protein
MTLETSKNLGGIGAILVVIAFIGAFGLSYAGLLGLVGLILMLIGAKGLADHYNEQGIFNNALYAVVMTIVGVVACVGVFVATLFTAIATLPVSDWTNSAEWIASFQEGLDLNSILTLLGAIAAALVVLFIFIVLAAIFYRKSLNILATKTGVGMFSTAGLLLLIDAVLTIIMIGLVIIWIAFILVAVAFFSIRTTAAETPQPPKPPTS